ncbi:N-acetylglucosaminyl-phosphatidylinositol [Staphylotrichum tortipilum]|uniref:N-acetylglucosaminyl-phosphatidylinositol n=1 Tax=Staphylotrichum tortipilum TaxID=2831512 RepID=A0AAN6RRL3_9PEZI|nr:N-acetylglucosaminyl-phosphatidylinositol [Staphylotrichum longicolle]
MTNPPTTTTTRSISTTTRVHPPYLVHIHNASRSRTTKTLKWIPPLAAVVTAGYAVASYREAHTAAAAEQAAEMERLRRNAAMADAYGDRGSLEELERAVRVYEEAQRRGK